MELCIHSNDYLESCIPEIPSQGTVGASGDLAPLAHLAAGKGEYRCLEMYRYSFQD
jgi:hypothetical protein